MSEFKVFSRRLPLSSMSEAWEIDSDWVAHRFGLSTWSKTLEGALRILNRVQESVNIRCPEDISTYEVWEYDFFTCADNGEPLPRIYSDKGVLIARAISLEYEPAVNPHGLYSQPAWVNYKWDELDGGARFRADVWRLGYFMYGISKERLVRLHNRLRNSENPS